MVSINGIGTSSFAGFRLATINAVSLYLPDFKLRSCVKVEVAVLGSHPF